VNELNNKKMELEEKKEGKNPKKSEDSFA